jgi:alkylation response protein AidB-like acyl-CoA dehydrogenase
VLRWLPQLEPGLNQLVEAVTDDVRLHAPFVRDNGWVSGYSRKYAMHLGGRGWLGMTWPSEFGGHERPEMERFAATATLLRLGAPIAACWFPERQIGPMLLNYGTQEQKQRLIPPMVAGEAAWCIGMSEPDAGSDLAGVRTRAVRASNGRNYVIDGAKIWTSGAEQARWCYLIARTDPAAPIHHGLSEFIVDMETPGIAVHPIRDMTGNLHFCDVTFDSVVVPAEALVGELNGSWRQVMRQLEHERSGMDRLLSNRYSYQLALATSDRSDPMVRLEIARLETMYRIGCDLVLRGVAGGEGRRLAGMTKVYCTDFEQGVAEFVSRVFGAETTLTGDIARATCYAPAYTIQGGTSEILRTVIGERILGLPREPAPPSLAVRQWPPENRNLG